MIPVAKPVLGDEEVAAAARAIRSGWVTQGPEVAAFEAEFSQFVDTPHACAVSNCTTALHLALLALDVKAGDDVLVPSHSYIATANAIRYIGARPIFVDVLPRMYNLDPDRLDAARTPRTTAIVVVHQVGMPADMRRIVPWAREHGIKIVEDAACAVGSQILMDGQWQQIGRPHGDIACFSFHPRKLLTTGDGGMITTRDAQVDARVRRWRCHSMEISAEARHASSKIIFEAYHDVGYNYRMTDIQAAVGREQLKRIPDMVARRRQQEQLYRTLLQELPLILPGEPEWARSNWQSLIVYLPDGVPQQAFMQKLLDAGVSTRRGVMNAHLEPAYTNTPDAWAAGGELKNSEWSQERGVILPLFDSMTEAEIRQVVEAVKAAL